MCRSGSAGPSRTSTPPSATCGPRSSSCITSPATESLRADIQALVAEYAESLGFRPRLTCTGPLDSAVPVTVRPQILAAIRESLSNVVRHAQASEVRVDVIVADGEVVTARVADNGVGFDAGQHGRAVCATCASAPTPSAVPSGWSPTSRTAPCSSCAPRWVDHLPVARRETAWSVATPCRCHLSSAPAGRQGPPLPPECRRRHRLRQGRKSRTAEDVPHRPVAIVG